MSGETPEAFYCDRIVIGGNFPEDWVVNDIQVGGDSQLMQRGDLPGMMFSAASTASFSLEPIPVGTDLTIVVTYVGKDEAGASFECMALGSIGRRSDLSIGDAVMPMSSSVVNVLPNVPKEIKSRVRKVAFRPEQIVIDGAEDWIVNEIKVGNRSQSAREGNLPGAAFSATSTLRAFSMDTVHVAMDFLLVVTYVGASPTGAPFRCGVVGTAMR